ncbi:fimbrial protein [Citrobacter freundii]|nr:fimbrial protein [Citrobacter freundii]EJB8472630.1 fimbrial protein [Citrobacter freundii]EJB8560965.1 fimbrial protein [Citrobacter freundii]MBA8030633.1 fimbrial protein [Citrobacter freundii]QLO05555.1 fimbrial protein [Citrobacter freundii]QLU68210.1 fimbrial protein [Citrobacter freundii]
MRNIMLMLLGFCACFQACSQSSDTLEVSFDAHVYVTACTAWVEDSNGVMSSLITLPPVSVSGVKNGQTAVGKTAFKVKFQCSEGDIYDIFSDFAEGVEYLTVRFTAKSELNPATQSLKNSIPENSNGAKDIGFLIKDRNDRVVQFETGTDPTYRESYTATDALCEHIDDMYRIAATTRSKESDSICGTYSFPYSVEYTAYGNDPGPGVVGADATVTVEWN